MMLYDFWTLSKMEAGKCDIINESNQVRKLIEQNSDMINLTVKGMSSSQMAMLLNLVIGQ